MSKDDDGMSIFWTLILFIGIIFGLLTLSEYMDNKYFEQNNILPQCEKLGYDEVTDWDWKRDNNNYLNIKCDGKVITEDYECTTINVCKKENQWGECVFRGNNVVCYEKLAGDLR